MSIQRLFGHRRAFRCAPSARLTAKMLVVVTAGILPARCSTYWDARRQGASHSTAVMAQDVQTGEQGLKGAVFQLFDWSGKANFLTESMKGSRR